MRISVPIKLVREEIYLRLHSSVPFDHLARIGRQAAQDCRHRAGGAVFGVVAWFVVPDRVEQLVVFLLIRISHFAPLEAPGSSSSANDVRADVAIALRTDHVLGNTIPATVNVPAEAEPARAVGIF